MRNFLLQLVVIAALVAIFPAAGVATDTDNGSAEAVKKQAQETLQAAKKFAEKQKQEYQKKIQAELDALSSRLETLRNQARSAQGDAQANLNRKIADLEKKQAAARQKLSEIKTAGVQAWQKLKSGLDSAVNELESAFQGLSGVKK